MDSSIQAALSSLPPPSALPYTIHSASGQTGNYHPSNILVHNPADQSSRWTGITPRPGGDVSEHESSGSGESGVVIGAGGIVLGKKRKQKEVQYITLELESESLITAIGFGKYQKVHPCNLAEFSVYGGLSPNPKYMELLFHAGLRNDPSKEKFELPLFPEKGKGKGRRKTDGPLPVKYLRIDAIAAHSPSYNVSIWHVWLEGYSGSPVLAPLIEYHRWCRESHATHLILAHLRRSALLQSFQTLLSSTDSETRQSFEHPLVTKLHRTLVLQGKFIAAEKVMSEILQAGLLCEWGQPQGKGSKVARWEKLGDSELHSDNSETMNDDNSIEDNVEEVMDWPRGRGGHQMVRVGRKFLLFGGWDGKMDLGDLWELDLPRDTGSRDSERAVGKWRCLDRGDEDNFHKGKKRPCKRATMQLAVDESTGYVYLLGGFTSRSAVVSSNSSKQTNPRSAPAAVGNGNVPQPQPSQNENSGELPADPGAATTSREDGANLGLVSDPDWKSHANLANNSDNSDHSKRNWMSDFWRYKAVGPNAGEWELLSEDTAAEGGPQLLFDHQMLVHSEAQRLYVYGGKTVQSNFDSDASEGMYSGMYCYDIASRKWAYLFGDTTESDAFKSERLLSRKGHSMLFDPVLQTLYIFAGQRHDRYSSDLWAVVLASPTTSSGRSADNRDSLTASNDSLHWRAGAVVPATSPITSAPIPAAPSNEVKTGDHEHFEGDETLKSHSGPYSGPTLLSIHKISSDYSKPQEYPNGGLVPSSVGPPPSFTQRASLNPTTGEWVVLTGLIQRVSSEEDAPCERIWTKSREGVWEEVLHSRRGAIDPSLDRSILSPSLNSRAGEVRGVDKPIGRYAGQVVYDPLRDEHYLFGGNPQDWENKERRLGDLWRLKIIKPSPEEALRMAHFQIRKQRFTELCRSAPTLTALHYLQTRLSSVVDHTDENETHAFRSCMSALLSAPPVMNVEVPMDDSGMLVHPSVASLSEDDDVVTDEGAKISTEDTNERGVGDDTKPALQVRDKELYKQRHALFERLLSFLPHDQVQLQENIVDLTTSRGVNASSHRQNSQRSRYD